MKNTLMLIIFFLLASASAYASAVTTMGAASCGEWVEARHNKDSPSASALYEAWLVGDLNGLAVATQVDFLKDINIQSLFLWVDNYCKSNPLKDLSLAGFRLSLELTAQMHK
jgi:hypothetical protein